MDSGTSSGRRDPPPARLRRGSVCACALSIASGLLLTGCAIPAPGSQADAAAQRSSGRAEREQRMNAHWQNRTLSELIRTQGPPRLFLDIPGGGSPPGFVMVYHRDPATGCLDTFALMLGNEPVIRVYQCR